MQIPTTPEQWLKVAKEFNDMWNFPHCLGALDGKHVVLQSPANSGSEFFNYKSTYSIVLFAVVNANYNFLYVDVGAQGRISDGGIFKNSSLYEKLQKNHLNLPLEERLEGTEVVIPYYFVGDEAFPLSDTLMKPFSGIHPRGSLQRIFNYRLSRARRVVENVFGISSAVFRVLRKPMLLEPNKAQLIVLTIAHLHNFLRNSSSSRGLYTPHGTFDEEINGELIEGTYRINEATSSLIPVRRIPRRSPEEAKTIRNKLARFFLSEGRIAWQDNYA